MPQQGLFDGLSIPVDNGFVKYQNTVSLFGFIPEIGDLYFFGERVYLLLTFDNCDGAVWQPIFVTESQGRSLETLLFVQSGKRKNEIGSISQWGVIPPHILWS